MTNSVKGVFAKSTRAPQKVAVALGALVMAFPVSAIAADATVWGRQTGLGGFETEKVTLTNSATITGATYEGGGSGFCIWAGAGQPKVVTCWNVGEDSLKGYVLPAGPGYFAIPAKRTENSPAYVQISVAY